jgi:DNA polymerase-3 subunit gamma/tau
MARKTTPPAATKIEAPETVEPPARKAMGWEEPDWVTLVPKLGLTAVNKQLASNCAYLKRDGDTLFFSLDHRSESYLTRERQEMLAKALSKYFDEKLKVEITVGPAEEETPVQVEKRKVVEELDAARAGLEADPNVKALKDMFGAELVPDSVEPRSGK